MLTQFPQEEDTQSSTGKNEPKLSLFEHPAMCWHALLTVQGYGAEVEMLPEVLSSQYTRDQWLQIASPVLGIVLEVEILCTTATKILLNGFERCDGVSCSSWFTIISNPVMKNLWTECLR